MIVVTTETQATLEAIEPLPAIAPAPGRAPRHPHAVDAVQYARPAVVLCSCGWAVWLPTDEEMVAAFSTHIRDARVARGLTREGLVPRRRA